MKIFISWSGDISKSVAIALRDWLPDVLQYVKPFLSKNDIPAGAGWISALAVELEDSHYGIICLNPQNVTAPWLMFEAGALSKQVDVARVVPFVVGLAKSDIELPLGGFQAIEATEEDVQKLVLDINDAAPDDTRLERTRVERAFETHWPTLAPVLTAAGDALATQGLSAEPRRSERDLLEEAVDTLRAQSRSLAELRRRLPQVGASRHSRLSQAIDDQGSWPNDATIVVDEAQSVLSVTVPRTLTEEELAQVHAQAAERGLKVIIVDSV